MQCCREMRCCKFVSCMIGLSCISPMYDRVKVVTKSKAMKTLRSRKVLDLRTKISQDIKLCRESQNIDFFSLWLIWNVPVDNVPRNLRP